MNKKWLIILSSVVLVVVVILFIAYKEWTKPYKLPEIKENISTSELQLDFSVEKELLAHPEFNLEPTNIHNKSQVILSKEFTASSAYYYAMSKWKQVKTKEDPAIQFLMAAVKDQPDNYEYSNTLRIKMGEFSETESFIDFMKEVKDTPKARLQTALAYVDLLQNPDLGTSVLGQKSSESIKILDQLIEENPYHVLARYARGLNNLYWPKGLLRSERAVQDLGFCLAIEQTYKGDNVVLWPLIYAAYGDALVKDGDVAAGMKAWKDGAAKYPNSEELKKRSQITESEALALVRKERGIDGFTRPDPSISDISIMWRECGSAAGGCRN